MIINKPFFILFISLPPSLFGNIFYFYANVIYIYTEKMNASSIYTNTNLRLLQYTSRHPSRFIDNFY
jgi:hypothetical protein